jgi:glycine dehydrogenase subunit 1
MRYLPKSPTERQEMLAAIGAQSIDELFSSIPERFRLREALKLPGPFSEAEVIQYFEERATENSFGYTSFLGAGVYNHLRSVVTDAIIQRGEFLTSYTPYQAEITQGTLQAIFEFQTLMCQLTGQQVANASMWDGSARDWAHPRPGWPLPASRISRCAEDLREELRALRGRDSLWRGWNP